MPLRNLWERPQVHVIFNDYTVSFSIKDINKALVLLRATGDSTQPAECGLDTAKDFFYELYPGLHQQYRFPMQPILQNKIGAYLLTAGHAVIANKKHRLLKEIITDIRSLELQDKVSLATFYDPQSHNMLFQGKLAAELYKQDLGIDD